MRNSSPQLTTLGNNVRAQRKTAGWSQADLARRAELCRTYITDIERGARNVTILNLNRIAAALEVSVSELCAITDASTNGGPEKVTKATSAVSGNGREHTLDLLADIRLLRDRIDRAHQRHCELLDKVSDGIRQAFRIQGKSAALLANKTEYLRRKITAIESEITAAEIDLDRALRAAA